MNTNQNFKVYVSILLFTICFCFPLNGQNNGSKTDSTQVETKVYIIENIGSETEKTLSLIRAFKHDLDEINQKEEADSVIKKRLLEVEEFQQSTNVEDVTGMDFRQTEGLRIKFENLRTQINGLRQQLVKISVSIGERKDQLSLLQSQWIKTLEFQKEKDRPEQLIERIESTIVKLKEAGKEVDKQNNLLITRQDELTGALIYIDEILTSINKAQQAFKTQIYTTDSPPIWSLLGSEKDTVSFSVNVKNIVKARNEQFGNVRKTYSSIFYTFGIITLLLFIGAIYFKKKMDVMEELKGSPSLELSFFFVSKPLSSSLLLAVILINAFFAEAPADIKDLVRLILVIPIVRILPSILPLIRKRYFYLSALVFIVSILSEVFTEMIIFNRLLLLGNGMLCLLVFYSVIKDKTILIGQKGGLSKFQLNVVRFGLISIVLSLLINAIGNMYLSTILFNGAITLVYGGVIIFSASAVLKSFMQLIVRHRTAVDLNVFRNYPDEILKWVFKIINWLAVIYWLYLTSSNYLIFDSIYDGIEKLLTNPLELGSVKITMGNILAFFLTLILTLYISKFIRFILKDEVFTHFEMPRGVPGAITMIVRLSLLGFGFILAFGAAEIDISNITIIFGALGVGIGFGLQNIFNNLVSGLILAFERPIQVGDVLQISNLNLMGEVKEIGIRASTIRTFDGAEVVVPNGNLISNEMVNWTLSDRRKRQELLVGVSYGTDMASVLKILDSVVNEQEGVLKKPSPFIIFKGFGDSSLDFRVLFWTHFDFGLSTKSRVGIAIDEAFKKEGITIPFPQRDLHIQSPIIPKESPIDVPDIEEDNKKAES